MSMAQEPDDRRPDRSSALFDRQVLQVLRPLSVSLATVFALAMVVNLVEGLPEGAAAPLVVTKAVLVVTFLSVYIALRRDWIASRLAHPLAVGIAGLTLLNVLLALILAGDSFYLVYIVIVLIGLGSVLLSLPWLIGAVAGVTIAWMGAAWSMLAGQQLLHYGFAIFSASAIAVVICLARREWIARTETALAAALSESDQRRKLSRAVEQSSSLLLITDTEGRIEYVNPKFTRTTGYALEEVIGRTPAVLKSPKTPAAVHEELWRTILAGQEWQGEFHNLKKSGESYRAIASISPIRNGEGTITHFVGVQEDVTERRKVEAQLVHAQKMEGIGQLVSGVAHDFNNLLTGIVGFADLSLATISDDDPIRGNLEQIAKAGESAMSLTRQLLVFSRQQARPPRIVDLNEVITGFQKLLRHTISEDVDLSMSLAADLGSVSIDPSQMEQILVNLAVNARDAMPQGGRLRIETAGIDLEETSLEHGLELAPGRYVMLSVSDSGHGMDEATSRRVFEPFFTTKERSHGTGLGLSTVYGIVKQSGGRITVESSPGEGTEFMIYLPRAEAVAADGGEKALPERTAGGEERVLLVEDDELVREFATKLLMQQGYEVRYAKSASDALERIEGFDVDLLVTDVVMPGMNGVELAEHLGVGRRSMKVLFLSGYADHGIIERRVLEAGATFLPKPFGVDEFVQTVRDLLDQ